MEIAKEILTFVALLGTGGVLGSWINELHRSRREDRLRWHVVRREAYERFLTAVGKWRNAEIEIAGHIGTLRESTGWGDDPLFDEEFLLRHAETFDKEATKYLVTKLRALRPVADEARDQVNASLAAIEMVANETVVLSATALREQVQSLIRTADQFPPRECGGWSDPLVEASECVTDTRTAFIQATRKELGVAPTASKAAAVPVLNSAAADSGGTVIRSKSRLLRK